MTDRGVALVTGAARRLGRVLALAAAQAGHDVALHVRSLDDHADAAAEAVRGLGREAAVFACDLADETATSALLGRAAAALGPVTLLINSASVFEEDSAAPMTRASWDRHIETNLRAPLVLAQAFAAELPAGRDGLIVNILDQRVWRPGADFFTYTLSKTALWSATTMLARALAPNIRVNGIGPGPTLPSIHQDAAAFAAEAAATPLGRAVDPRDAAQALRFLIETPSVTGQMIAIDSGQHLT